jgi:hypothetical protein
VIIFGEDKLEREAELMLKLQPARNPRTITAGFTLWKDVS